MGKYKTDDIVNALIKADVPQNYIDDFIRASKPEDIASGISKSGRINPKLMQDIKIYLGERGFSNFNKLNANNKIIVERVAINIIDSREMTRFFDRGGRLILDVDDLGQSGIARVFGKSTDDIATMADDVNVKNAAETRRSDLIKLGISGSLVSGVVFLMLMTGKMNPVEAIAEALKMAAEAAGDAVDAGGDIFAKMFSGASGFFNVSASFVLTLIAGLVVWSVVSIILKR